MPESQQTGAGSKEGNSSQMMGWAEKEKEKLEVTLGVSGSHSHSIEPDIDAQYS